MDGEIAAAHRPAATAATTKRRIAMTITSRGAANFGCRRLLGGEPAGRPAAGQKARPTGSESKCRLQLQHAPALLRGDRAEQRRVHKPGGSVKPEIPVRVIKRPQRMIQE